MKHKFEFTCSAGLAALMIIVALTGGAFAIGKLIIENPGAEKLLVNGLLVLVVLILWFIARRLNEKE